MSSASENYMKWFYNNNIWKNMSYRGVRTLKLPQDMWNYQEIIEQHDIQWIIEAGTRHGGSGLFFADLLTARQARGRVVSIDITHDALHPSARTHPKLVLIKADTGDQRVAEKVLASIPKDTRGRIFLILDSDHSADHVYRELTAFVPRLLPGDYVIVEDTIVNGHPVRPDFGPGPWEAIERFKQEFPSLLQADIEREQKFGCTAAANGFYRRL